MSRAIAGAMALAGTLSMVVAISNERRMHRHRQPGVTYSQATYRRDGGWRRTDLFTPDGLTFQRRAARHGFIAVVLWVLALGAYIVGGLKA